MYAYSSTSTINALQVYDGYPKARVHLLLLPKPAFLAVNAATDLRREHLERHVDKYTLVCLFYSI